MKYFIASILIVALGLLGILNPLKNFVVLLVSPVQFGLVKSAYVTKDASNFFSHVNEVRKQNLELRQDLQAAQDTISKLKFVQDENSLLKSQLDLKVKDMSDEKALLAEVMVSVPTVTNDVFTINVGSKDGVRSGDMAVIGVNVVGTVENVDYGRSTVRLITSPKLSFTVYDLDKSEHPQGLAKGKHSTFVMLERILSSETIGVGDTIVTSGKDGIFKPNYVVGAIKQVFEDPSQPLKSAEIKTSVDFSRINKLFVIKVTP